MRNTILHGDCLAVMADLPKNSFDLIFADPPYNLQLPGRAAGGDLFRPDASKVDGCAEGWDQFDSFSAYDSFTQAWLTIARSLLKKDGALWTIGTYHNIFRVGSLMQSLGYWILNDIVWVKSNPMPNFRGSRFTNAHETLIWASREKASRKQFNYAACKAANDDRQMRSDWYFPLCRGSERLTTAKGEKVHPTQKPEALLARILTSSTRPGDLVLDPFFGTGTTGAVARKLGRDFVGIERDIDYVKAAQKRIDAIRPVESALLDPLPSARQAPRISFGQLVETDLVKAGERLRDPSNTIEARVRADGTIATAQTSGSIHQVGAKIQGLASCNGWTFWSCEREGKRVLLDALRAQARAQAA